MSYTPESGSLPFQGPDWERVDASRLNKVADQYLAAGKVAFITAFVLLIITGIVTTLLYLNPHWAASAKIMEDAMISTGAVGNGLALIAVITAVIFRSLFQNRKVLKRIVDPNKFIQEDNRIINAIRNFDAMILYHAALHNKWKGLDLQGDLTQESTWTPLVKAGYITQEVAQLMADTLKNYKEYLSAKATQSNYPQDLVSRRNAKNQSTQEEQQLQQYDWGPYDKAQNVLDKYTVKGSSVCIIQFLNSLGLTMENLQAFIQNNCALPREGVSVDPLTDRREFVVTFDEQ